MRRFSEPFAPLSEAARRQSREAALADAPRAHPAHQANQALGDLWLFGYGSLLWDAPCPYLQSLPARLRGWRRRMCVWTALARGTPDRPGLSLGLLSGGACDGIAFRIGAADLEAALPVIWHREMWTDIYCPTWVTIQTDDGDVAALTFTVNQASRQYAGGLAHDQIVTHIATAQGERGPCREYLANTVAQLRAMGITDTDLEALQDAVAARPRVG